MKTKKKRGKTEDYEAVIRRYVYDKAQQGEKITNADLINHIQDQTGIAISDSQIRIIINDLRNEDVILLLLADKKGFFIATSENEVKEWIQMHKKKIESMQLTLKSIKRQLRMKKSICEYLGETF